MQMRWLMTLSNITYSKYAKWSYLEAQTIETWQRNSTGNTPRVIKKLCPHGNSLFSSPYPLDFNYVIK